MNSDTTTENPTLAESEPCLVCGEYTELIPCPTCGALRIADQIAAAIDEAFATAPLNAHAFAQNAVVTPERFRAANLDLACDRLVLHDIAAFSRFRQGTDLVALWSEYLQAIAENLIPLARENEEELATIHQRLLDSDSLMSRTGDRETALRWIVRSSAFDCAHQHLLRTASSLPLS